MLTSVNKKPILNNVVFARPSGNDTALVFDPVPYEDYAFYNDRIQKKFPNIEQVMFVKKKEGKPFGQMAGGEFCANATRALGFVLLEGRDGKVSFNVSGLNRSVSVSVKAGKASVTLNIFPEKKDLELLGEKITAVKLEGITHAVVPSHLKAAKILCEMTDEKKRKETALKYIYDLGLDVEPASGLIIAEPIDEDVNIIPYVYVRDLKTLHEETACASGSLAAVLCNNAKRRTRVKQPSGLSLFIELEPAHNNMIMTKISGAIETFYQGALDI